jgi:hypothetical protein
MFGKKGKKGGKKKEVVKGLKDVPTSELSKMKKEETPKEPKKEETANVQNDPLPFKAQEKKPEEKAEKKAMKQGMKITRTKNSIYHSFSRLAPPTYRKYFENNLVYAEIDTLPDVYVGRIMIISLIPVFLTLGALMVERFLDTAIIMQFIDRYLFFGLGIAGFITIHVLFNLFVFFKISSRTRGVEDNLPDALQLTAANVRAGMTPFVALRTAARPEFGLLADEIALATNRALGSKSFEVALEGIKKRIKSPSLDRVVRLFITGTKSGGRIAELLEATAGDLIESAALKQELITQVKMYSMFVLFVVMLAMPVLLNISIHFTNLVSGLSVTLGLESGAQQFLKTSMVSKVAVTTDFLRLISYAIIISSGFLSSILIGVIKEGNKKYGMKFVPLVWGVAMTVFILSDSVIAGFLTMMV